MRSLLAIKGREQQLIDLHARPQSEGGSSGSSLLNFLAMNLELKELKEKCILIANLIRVNGGGDVMNEYIGIINTTYERGNKRGLKTLINDLTEWASGLNLDISDKAKSVAIENEAQVVGILNKGKISTDLEYRLILDFVNQHYDDLTKKERVKEANLLLNAY